MNTHHLLRQPSINFCRKKPPPQKQTGQGSFSLKAIFTLYEEPIFQTPRRSPHTAAGQVANSAASQRGVAYE